MDVLKINAMNTSSAALIFVRCLRGSPSGLLPEDLGSSDFSCSATSDWLIRANENEVVTDTGEEAIISSSRVSVQQG